MVKLNINIFKYLTHEEFRVLTAIELGMRNHEYVPIHLIESLSKIKKINTHNILMKLLKNKLVQHNNQNYDGYSLNYLGYDFLAIRALLKKGILVKILNRMGVGKESDVYYCLINTKGFENELNDEEILKAQLNLIDEIDNKSNHSITSEINNKKENIEEIQDIQDSSIEQENSKTIDNNNLEYTNNLINKDIVNINDYNQLEDVYNNPLIEGNNLTLGVLKLARLGRTSFRAVKSKRDFVKNKSHYNWLYMSRLSAQTENKFLTGLYTHGFPVPKPFGCNRHAIVMENIKGFQLSKVNQMSNPEKAYNNLIRIIYKLAENGLVHGDFNEFNILIEEKTENVKIIDFTQMISRDHSQAALYFKRDINGVKNFFKKKLYLNIFDNDESINSIEDDLSNSNAKEDEIKIESKANQKNFESNIINDSSAEIYCLEKVERLDFLDVKFNAFGCVKKHDNKYGLEEITKLNNKDNEEEINDNDYDNDNELAKELNIININNNNYLNDITNGNNNIIGDKTNIINNQIIKEKNIDENSLIITKEEIKRKVMRALNKDFKKTNKTKINGKAQKTRKFNNCKDKKELKEIKNSNYF